MNILARQTEHYEAIENLLDESFGKNRHRRISYAIRAGNAFIPNLSYVLLDKGHLIATISCWPIYLQPIDNKYDARSLSLIMVGPIAVSQSYQNLGYGRMLINKVIKLAHDNALEGLVMIGDPDYYSQFDFTAMDNCAWQLPGPYESHRLLMHGDARDKLPKTGLLSPNIAKSNKLSDMKVSV